jgi:hypothetical protein
MVVLVRAALGKHLLELLFLRVAQQGLNLAVRILHEGLDLGVAIFLAERGVGAQGLHLLQAVGEDGLDLRHLIAGEAELLPEMRGLLAGVEGAVLARLRWSSGLVGVRRLCEHECHSGRKQNAQCDSCFCAVSHFSFPPSAVCTFAGHCVCRHNGGAGVAQNILR